MKNKKYALHASIQRVTSTSTSRTHGHTGYMVTQNKYTPPSPSRQPTASVLQYPEPHDAFKGQCVKLLRKASISGM